MKINKLNVAALALTALAVTLIPFTIPCDTEDATACTWNASEQGNGAGSSFTDFWGITLYHP